MITKKITLNELRSLVKQIIKEEIGTKNIIEIPYKGHTLYLGVNQNKQVDFVDKIENASKIEDSNLQHMLSSYFQKNGNDYYTGNGTATYPDAKNIKISVQKV